jgi:hypothetical protein
MSPILGIYASQISGHLFNYYSIATVNVGSGGSSNISFTSIPQGYTHLQIRFMASDTNGGNWGFCNVKFNNLGTNYGYRHDMYGTGSTAGSSKVAGAYPMVYCGPTSQFGVGIIDILDYANTNKNKTVRAISGTDQNGGGLVAVESGSWMNTAAITQIDLFPGTSFTQYSSFALYGVK